LAAYYNEFDAYAAEWLRNLIKAGHIAPGDVDERSIEDVSPDDLKDYTQCHFFAGIGVWSHALRRAGWPDDREVWTGSCPCQPFSAAGKRAGFADERHLWPAFHHLIRERRPAIVFGEQVASKDGLGWLDLVQADLEETHYASGAVDLCAAGVGAPHIRQRLWWVAERLGGVALGDPFRSGLEGQRSGFETARGHGPGSVRPAAEAGEFDRVADAERRGWPERRPGSEPEISESDGTACGLADQYCDGCEQTGVRFSAPRHDGVVGNRTIGGVADDACGGRGEERPDGRGLFVGDRTQGLATGPVDGCSDFGRPGPTNGHWRDADWLFCRDGKWRPVEPGTFPLAHGAPARVGRLRAYGNAIVAEAAQVFIESYLDTRTIFS